MHIFYMFLCASHAISWMFLKNMKNVKLTKMKIFKNLLMHSTWVKVLVFFLKDFSLSVCQIIPYLQLSWIIHTLVLSVSLLHISVCSNPPALSLVLSSRVVVGGGGRRERKPQESFMVAAPETTCSQALLYWHFFYDIINSSISSDQP